MINEHAMQSNCQTWSTPSELLPGIRSLFQGTIALDPCTSSNNPLRATRFYTERDDGLLYPWEDRTWCNPPFGSRVHWSKREFGDSVWDWILKAQAEASNGFRIGLYLSVSRTDRPPFQDLIREATCFQFLEGKQRHGGQNDRGAMLANWIFWFNVPAGEVQAHLGHRGVVCTSC